ncbi:hypothetical protein R1flu_009029 [Riccia fluitans]|uniref:NB-ARC domain-containing protein n=1 Tax=Riccia fluitans TaxID=41844 RepID=A0ABD1Z0X0_9MARC
MDGIGKSTLAKQLLIHVRNQFDFACFLEFEDVQTKPKWEDIEKLVARNLFRGREKSRLVITTYVKGLMSQYGFIEHDVPFMSPSESEELFKRCTTEDEDGLFPQWCFLRCDSNQFSEDTAGSVRKIYIHPALRNMGRWISTDLTKGKILQGRKELWELNEGGTAEKLETLSILLEPTQSSLDSWNWGSIQGFSHLRLLRMSHVNMREDYDDFSLPRSLGKLHMINCSGPTQRSWPWEPFLSGIIDWPVRKGEVEFLHRLSVLVFDHCNMVRLPTNFHKLQNLRILRIHDESMRELPKTISRLPALEDFTLSAPVESLPDSLLEMPTLRKMEISSCSFLRMWPTPRKAFASCQLASLVELSLVDLCALVELPDSFGGMRPLKTLSLRRCSALRRLPDGFGALQELRPLVIEDCVKLEELCESFHNLCQLGLFSLSRLPALQMLPINFGLSPSLEYLRIRECRALMELPQNFLEIQSLVDVEISACEGLSSFTNWRSKALRFKLLPDSFGQLKYLRDLKIVGCEKLETLPETLGQLESLGELEIRDCPNLTSLPMSPGKLKRLFRLIIGCVNLKALPEDVGILERLIHLRIIGCEKLETLPESLGRLELMTSEIRSCVNLKAVPKSLKLDGVLTLIIVDCQYLKSVTRGL